MLDRGKRRKQFESFVSNADLNAGVYKTKTSENQRTSVIQSNAHNSISQISTRCITQSLNSILKGLDPQKYPYSGGLIASDRVKIHGRRNTHDIDVL